MRPLIERIKNGVKAYRIPLILYIINLSVSLFYMFSGDSIIISYFCGDSFLYCDIYLSLIFIFISFCLSSLIWIVAFIIKYTKTHDKKYLKWIIITPGYILSISTILTFLFPYLYMLILKIFEYFKTLIIK